jgi:TetR/AcrR family transcriptional regulator, transcriptional repressor for nem operon
LDYYTNWYIIAIIPIGIIMNKAEKTKQYIIEKTAPVFSKKGFAGTSLSDLTEATGLTKGSIYGNFKNKDEVAVAAFEYNFRFILETLKAKVAEADTVIEKLQVMVDFHRNTYGKNYIEAGCPIANLAPEADDTHPELRESINKAIEKWDKGIQNLIKEGVQKGEIKKGVNSSAFASTMISLIEGGVMLSKSTGNLKYFNNSLSLIEKEIVNIQA